MAKEIKVGITVAAAIAILVFGLRWLAGWKTGYSRQQVEIEFANGGGLKKADRVLVHGIFMGRVHNVSLTKDGVLVRIWLDSDVVLKEDASAEIEATTFLRGARVLLDTGESGKQYDFSRPIRGKPGVDLNKIIITASHILETTDEMLETISTGLLSADGLKRVDRIISGLDEATRDFGSSASELKELLSSNQNSLSESIEQIEEITETLDSLLVNLKRGEGTAGKILSDDELYEQLVAGIKELRELIEDIKSNPKKYFSLF